MSRNAYLYRRPSGIYAVRICIPQRFQLRLGKRELHISTGHKSLAAAKISSLPLVHEWKRTFLEWDGLAMSSEMSATKSQVVTNNKTLGANGPELRASELLARFTEVKSSRWGEEQRKKMTSMCGMFVELMEDPCVGAISRSTLREFRKRLLALPENIYQTRRRYSAGSVSELAGLVNKHRLSTMKERAADSYLSRVGEMLGWAVREQILEVNPALGIVDKTPRNSKDQDARERFSDSELCRIFSAWWFAEGNSESVARGKRFHPYYYWLPLLGLYTGARLNEICQLYTDDIKEVEGGCWVIHVNCHTSEVVGSGSGLPDKKIKTANSDRYIAIHERLVELGLIKYKIQLEAHGFARLFPELKHDRIKGYGKAAGKWFNERYLGGELGIVRNGMKSFHSLRHQFITALFGAEVPEVYVAQLAGHERGETLSAKRYRKDSKGSQLAGYVNRLEFPIPEIKPFDPLAGVRLVEKMALRRRVAERAAARSPGR